MPDGSRLGGIPMSEPDLDEERRHRSGWTAFLETRGVVGQHAAPHEVVRVRATDGVRLTASHLPGPTAAGPAVLLLHGFGAHRRKPAYAGFADHLSEHVTVLSLDLRGHGRSDGASTLGADERHDVAGGVAWLRAHGHGWVAVIGALMGATSAATALDAGLGVDAVVMISGPAWLRDEPPSEAMQRLKRAWESRVARGAMWVGLGIRVVPPQHWVAPRHPVDAIAGAEVPLLVVHGEDDAYFPMGDAEALAASGAGVLWREPAPFGHAEDGLDHHGRFAARVVAALDAVRAGHPFPEREGRA